MVITVEQKFYPYWFESHFRNFWGNFSVHRNMGFPSASQGFYNQGPLSGQLSGEIVRQTAGSCAGDDVRTDPMPG